MRFDNYSWDGSENNWYKFDDTLEMNLFKQLNEGKTKFVDSMKLIFNTIVKNIEHLKSNDNSLSENVTNEHKQACKRWSKCKNEYRSLFETIELSE